VTAPLSLLGLLDDHLLALEQQGKGRGARKAYQPVFSDLLSFLKAHRGLSGRTARQSDDAHLLSAQELMAWRDAKLAVLSARTVKNKHMAAVKAVLQRAADDKKLEENVALGVKVRAAAPGRTRPKGYTDDEALVVLKAAHAYEPIIRDNAKTTESAKLSAAKRWGPWLCAFTGARIVEIMQLRRINILKEGEIDFIRISPAAGSVKSGLYRDVPLHPQLIELGFLEFVAKSTSEYLFCTPSDDPQKRPAEVPAGRLSTWLREANLSPPGVQPSHAWRHRFKTQAIDLGLNLRVVDDIQGHTGRTASDGYGDVSLKAKHAAITRLPRYDV
jgi:integrase